MFFNIIKKGHIVRAAESEEAPNPKSGFEFAQELPGITKPLGFWDPAGFCENTSPGEVKRYREAELTHGRVAMLATIGYLVGELPGVEANPLFNAKVTGPALRQFQQVCFNYFSRNLFCAQINMSTWRIDLTFS